MTRYVEVAAADDVGPGTARRVNLEDRVIALVRTGDGALYAVDDTCTHEKESLSAGFIEGTTIECPRHGAIFDLTSGKALTLPATRDLRAYEVKVENGNIVIGI